MLLLNSKFLLSIFEYFQTWKLAESMISKAEDLPLALPNSFKEFIRFLKPASRVYLAAEKFFTGVHIAPSTLMPSQSSSLISSAVYLFADIRSVSFSSTISRN
jgi:hypothetical protein